MYFQILLIKKKKKERIRYNKMTKINIVTRYNVKKIHNRSIIIQSNISKYQRFIWDHKNERKHGSTTSTKYQRMEARKNVHFHESKLPVCMASIMNISESLDSSDSILTMGTVDARFTSSRG